jgi:hypothetical protein
MELANQLRRALAGVCAAGPPEVRENGQWLATLDGMQYEVREQGGVALLHLWSAHQSLVRRVMSLPQNAPDRVVIEVARLGHSRNAQMEFIAGAARRESSRVERERFRDRLRRILADRFPDETVDSLSATPDLHHSISGSYVRGLCRRGADAHAILAAAPDEDSATIDRILTFGLIWLDYAKNRARRYSVRGLRLLVPSGHTAVTAHRLNALACPQEIELYEYERLYWHVRRVAISDAGNLATWIVPRREIDQALAAAMSHAERIRSLAPENIHIGYTAATQEVTLRFRGLEFARWRLGSMWFGLGEHPQELTPGRWHALETLVHQLELHRNATPPATAHRLYRGHPERWLEMLVAGDPSRIDPRLDGRYVYTQVPAFSVGDRGIIDLLGVMRDGRLAILELKASEDIHVVMQAVDYWLRVRWHHEQDDFRRFGYFPGVALQAKPPLLFLIAPGFQFHPANDIVLRYLSRDIEVVRVGLGENWRRGLRVVLRQ